MKFDDLFLKHKTRTERIIFHQRGGGVLNRLSTEKGMKFTLPTSVENRQLELSKLQVLPVLLLVALYL